MTKELEQKAEKYAINMWGNEEAFIDERNNCKQDYITGATENGVQWHKTVDSDLPKDTSVKRVFADDNKYYRLYYSHGRWVYCDKGGFHFFGNVIAWCEEPQFKE